MLGTRILVILSEMPEEDALIDTLLSAISHGARPFGMRFALPQGFEGAVRALPTEVFGGALSQGSLLFYQEQKGLHGVLPLVTDETHFLSLRGAHRFSGKWDQGLTSRFRVLPSPAAVMTASVSSPEEGLPPQAFLPAVAESFGEPGARLSRGLPLVCAKSPVKTMIINPDVLFGKVDFLRQAETTWSLLSIAAFVAGFHVYALEALLFWPVKRPKVRWLEQPDADTLPRPNLARFEQLCGFQFEKRMAGARTTLGLFTTEDGYPQQMPTGLAISQRAKALAARATHPMPLFVSAFYELPDALKPAISYLIRFAYLRVLSNLPLALYAGGRQERALRGMFPNTFSYPDNALLPRSLLQEGMLPMQHFQRNKLLLLQRAMNAYPGFAHYAWVDVDVLPHPVCPQAMPDFSPLMDETIHLATVNGVLDGAFMVVPQRHMKLLVREVNALTQVDAALKRSFSEQAMLMRLVEKFPDLFTLHPMPQKHLLFLTGFPSTLLSEEIKALLRDLPPAVRQAAPINDQKARKLL